MTTKTIKLPQLSPYTINVFKKHPSKTDINQLDHLVIVLPDEMSKDKWQKIQHSDLLESLYSKSDRSSKGIATRSHLPNKNLTKVTIGCVQKGRSSFQNLSQMRQLLSSVKAANKVGLLVSGFSRATHDELSEALLSAALAANFSLWTAKKSPKTNRQASRKRVSLSMFNAYASLPVDQIKAEAAGNNLNRWLTALPPNYLNSPNYIKLVKQLAKSKNWSCKHYTIAQLKRLGAEAFLAVARGNPHQDAGILHLTYRPSGKKGIAKPDLALVGKGICFDTGGTNLKPHASMLGMKGDMGGSSTALGSFLALSEQKSDLTIDCWLAITENCIDANAYLPSEVVTAINGTTIEVIHTDAEGRMALADTLSLVSKTKPKLIMDFATLTGAAVYSVTPRYSCVFTNRPHLHQDLINHGVKTGERVWPFPQDEDYNDNLKSEVADTLQCSTKPGGDHILASLFLNKFVDNKSAWIHMDLSASENNGGLAHIPTKETGFGVRYTSRLISEGSIFKNLKA